MVNFLVSRKTFKFVIDSKNNNFIIRKTAGSKINIKVSGRGPRGPAGADGASLVQSVAGKIGNVLLTKEDVGLGGISVVAMTGNYSDLINTPAAVKADATYVQYFTAQSFIVVHHGLLKYPSVTIIDSAGEEVIGSIDYIDANTVNISFTYPTSGVITCN